MKKIAVNSLLLASVIGLTACSNSDDSTVESNGAAAFMHSVPDVGYIYADGSERPYGSLSYRSVSGLVSLEPGTYDLSATQLDVSDPASSPVVLSGASFTVTESTLGLHVFAGSYEDENVSLTSLELSEDTADNSSIYLKVANINPGIGAVDIYFSEDGQALDIANTDPDATIAEMGSSGTISLSSSSQQLIVTTAGTDDVLFDSGVKTIADNARQIIVLAESPAADINDPMSEKINAFYYSVSALDLWSSNDGQTEIRVLNALNTESITSAEASIVSSSAPEDLNAVLPVGAVSSYKSLPSNSAYEISLEYTSGSEFAVVSLVSGLKLTFAVVGSAANNDIQVVKISDDQQNIFTESKLSITHLGYNVDEDELLSYDVHLLRQGVSEDLDTRIPEVGALSFKNTAKFTKNKGEYSVVVKETGSNSAIPSISLDLTDGSNHQLAIIQSGGGYKVCDINDSGGANSCE